MKTPRKSSYASILCGGLLVVTAGAQTMIEGFEYATDAELLANWSPQSAALSLSTYKAASSTGAQSMRVDRFFPANAWETEIITGQALPAALVIATNQYVTVRVAGDPQFTNATYQTLFIYAYDSVGNFGRWGAPVPTTSTNWQVLNFIASSIAAPWDSPGLPSLSDIVQLKFFLYGQGDPAGPAYQATIYIDDLQVRDTPLVEVPPTYGPKMIENFEEYASDADLQAAWTPHQGATVSLSSYVPYSSTGTNSLRLDRYFSSSPWDTEIIGGQPLPTPMAIGNTQYLTLRVAGDPQFTNGTYQTLFVYAFDGAGNFGRWGGPVPTTTTNWQVVNYTVSSMGIPWNSPGAPDLTDIVRFDFYLYGQGDPAGPGYQATIYIDDVQVRDTPLIEFPAPAPMRALIDDFEKYADDAALMSFYHYVDSPPATVTTASLATPAPQGTKALKLAIDFAPGQWPWGSVYSAIVPPFSLPTNAVVSLSLKGDPTLAPVADDGTVFYLSFYDAAGNNINFTTPAAPVISSDWTKLQASFGQFWSGSVVDTGNLVQWRILVEGWKGTADSQPLSGTFYVDNIVVTVPPVLAVVQQGSSLLLRMSSLIPGTTYTLRQTPDFSQWTTTTIQATAATQTWTIPAGQQKGFFQLYYTP